MKKYVQYPIFFYLLSLFLLITVFYKCQKEDISNEYTAPSDLKFQKSQEDFSLADFKDEWVKNNMKVDWEHSSIIKKNEDLIVEEFRTNLTKTLSPEKAEDDYQIKLIYKVLKTTSGTKSTYSIIQYQIRTDNNLKSPQVQSLKTMDQFNGGVAYFDLKGDLSKMEGYDNGKLNATINKSTLTEQGEISNVVPPVGADPGRFAHVISWGMSDSFGFTMSQPAVYIYSTKTSAHTSYVYRGNSDTPKDGDIFHSHYDNPNRYPHGGGGGPGTSNNNVNHSKEDIIIIDPSLKALPCVQKVVEQAYGKSSPLTKLIFDIFGTNDKVNLTYKISSSIPSNGRTSQTYNFNSRTNTMDVVVNLRDTYVNTATDLSIARTTVHESVHAMLVYMLEEDKLTSVTGTPDPGFGDLVEAFINYNNNKPSNYGKAHHEVMTEFVEDMATSLSAYGNNKGYNLPFNYYKDLSWGGLLETPTFNTLYPEYSNPNDATNNPQNRNPNHIRIVYNNLSEQNNKNETYQFPNGSTHTSTPNGKAVGSDGNCN